MIEKQDLITAFQNGCVLNTPKEVFNRSLSVKYQFQRNIWELDDNRLGRIRISDIDKCSIKLFPLDGKSAISFEITKKEYEELRILYFGEFTEDTRRLENLNKSLNPLKYQ